MRCNKCSGLLIQGAETCMACGKPNPGFRPVGFRYTTPIGELEPQVGRPRVYFTGPRPADPHLRIERWPKGIGHRF